MPTIVSAAGAVKAIADGAAVAVNSPSGPCCPDAVLQALGERFDREGHPRNLTMLHPIAAGDFYGVKGVDRIAKPGLIGRIIGGSYPSGPSSAEPPRIWRMLCNNEMPAYNVPSGIMFDMIREAAAKRPGVLTKVGLDTFADPDREGCAMNAMAARLAARGPLATQAAKMLINAAEGEEWERPLEALAGSVASASAGLEEGVQAFREKRKPVF
jgi:propionate CoA-transferase